MSKRKPKHHIDKTSSSVQQTITGLVLATSLVAMPALAAEPAGAERSYHISSGTLSHALSQFAGNAGIMLSADARLTDGKTSQGLEGEFTVERGLQKLLVGTGLTYTFTAGDAVAIKVAESSADVSTLPAVRVEGKAVYNEADPYNQSYNRTSASAATKTDTPLMQTPMSVQVVPKALMNDQQDIRIEDALTKNVSGVQRTINDSDLYENFAIRGFTTESNIYRNGLRRALSFTDPANIEQLEVLKGPSAVLYGRIEPGGMVNYVTKKPLATPYYSLSQQFGSYDQYRTVVDATGPIDQKGTLGYRFNAAYQEMGSFRDFIQNDRVFIAPTLSWKPNDRFEANLDLEYRHENRVNNYGIPIIGGKPADIPLSRYLGDASKGPEMDSTLVAYDWTFSFNDDWKIKNRFLWENFDNNLYDTPPSGLDTNTGDLSRFLITGNANQETYATNLDLLGKFQLLGTKHDVLIGTDFNHTSFEELNGRFTFGVLPSINIYKPQYGQIDQNMINNLPFDDNFIRKESWYGIYFQDQITLWDKLHIMGGGRYDWAQRGSGGGGTPEKAREHYNDLENQKFSPRVGILYQAFDWLSVYGNYTESLGTQNGGRSRSGQQFDAQSGEQFEAGFKTELFDKRLSSTIAYYHLTKNNLLTSDPTDPSNIYQIAVGEARSQGIEVDIKGQITEQLNMVATYAYTDNKITKDNSGFVNNRLVNIPEHQASLWGTYQLTPHFKFGMGGIAVGSREGDFANTFQLPGYVRMDAMAAYSMPVGKTRLTAQINIHNLLDKEYFAGSSNSLSVIPGEPLSAMGLLKLEY